MTDRHLGKPGEPGEPGTPPGGSGGRGGAGGTGDRAHLAAVVAFVIIVAIALGTGTLILTHHVQGNTDQIATNLTHVKQATYRICIRTMVTRVAVNSDKGSDEPKLPLYDCTPNLTGEAAVAFTRKQEKAFILKVKRDGYRP